MNSDEAPTWMILFAVFFWIALLGIAAYIFLDTRRVAHLPKTRRFAAPKNEVSAAITATALSKGFVIVAEDGELIRVRGRLAGRPWRLLEVRLAEDETPGTEVEVSVGRHSWVRGFHDADFVAKEFLDGLDERLTSAPPVQSSLNSYDNAMVEAINSLYKAEVIRRRRTWKGLDEVQFATLEWVDWFNHRRLLESIGDIPPAEFERSYYEGSEPDSQSERLNESSLR